MKKEAWKIFINVGTLYEFALTESLSFESRKKAEYWCKDHNYPRKCVMRESEYNEMKKEMKPLLRY